MKRGKQCNVVKLKGFTKEQRNWLILNLPVTL